MRCIVTAGPTYEPLDEVRRLTNFSTGELGCLLADALAEAGHYVTLLLGKQATYRKANNVKNVIEFATSESLKNLFYELKGENFRAIFHCAAVCDYCFGKTYLRDAEENLSEFKSGKFQTSLGNLLVELVPTEKIISRLRKWYPDALIIGWKYEVDGTKSTVVEAGKKQIAENKTDGCVLNGSAYGVGYGILFKEGDLIHYEDKLSLADGLKNWLTVVKK